MVLTGLLEKTNNFFIFLNQLRKTKGVMPTHF